MFFNNWDELKLKSKLHIWLKRQRRSHMTCNAPPYRCRVFKSNFCFRREHSKCCLVPFCWSEGGAFCLLGKYNFFFFFVQGNAQKKWATSGSSSFLRWWEVTDYASCVLKDVCVWGREGKAQMKCKRDVCIKIYDRGAAVVLTRPSSVCPSQI